MKKYTIIISVWAVLFGGIFAFQSCSNDNSYDASPGQGGDSGQGGSMARFTVVGDYMYTVSNNKMNVVSLLDPAHPIRITGGGINFRAGDIETIFPMDNYLFIGSRSALYIYDITLPDRPVEVGRATHFTSCDPVVAAGDYAYVTLNGGSTCNAGNRNELIVYDITDVTNPSSVKVVPMKSPLGLGIDNAAGRLFVCDGGLVMFDVTDPESLSMYDIIGTSNSVPGAVNMDAYDVIVLSDKSIAVVIGADGLYQFSYNEDKLRLLSKIEVIKQ